LRPAFLTSLLACVACLASEGALCAVAILFEHTNLQGQSIVVRNALPNLDRTSFNDRAESILIREGLWEVCTDANYRGRCVQLAPGEYRSLSKELTRSISSLREVARAPARPVAAPAPAPPHGRPVAMLYSDPNFGGRELLIDDQVVANLADLGFYARPASMRIVGGFWLFCTETNFQGTCLTFGPGEYPRLSGDVASRISSGHRVEQRDLYVPPAPPR
jgi:hypothetical protein